MTPERHARIKAIFLEACRLAGDEREAYLVEACAAEDSLRPAVDELLRYHDHLAGSGTDQTRTAADTAESPAAEGDTRPLPADSFESPRAPARAFQAGRMVAGRYRIVAALGAGGMGEVYRAEDTQLEQTVALKFLPPELARDPAWLIRLRNEVRVAREITHPNVCRVYDIGECDGDCFISMEYIDGEDLRSLLRRIGRLPHDKAMQIAHQLCAGLAAAHAKGVLHRDLKPANVMLDGRGNVRLMDFGLAGARDQIRGLDLYAGTPGYMAPEQITGRDVSVRSDIYALGLVLYELCTGRAAFQAASREDFVRAHRSDRPAAPSTLVQDIEPAVERIILRCLEKDPGDRPESALAVSAALPGGDVLAAALAAGETPSPTLVAQAGEKTGLRKSAALTLLAALAAGLAAVVLLGAAVDAQRYAAGVRAPVLLREAAREHVRALAEPALRSFEAQGLTFERQCAFLRFRDPARQASPPRYALPAGEDVLYWYRQGERPLVPREGVNLVFGAARPTPADPSPLAPGMASVVLAAGGGLLGFEAAPALVADAAPARPADWADLLAQAGFDVAAWTPAEPSTWPRLHADAQAAWVNTPGQPAAESGPSAPHPVMRIEAALRGGRLATLAVLEDQATPAAGLVNDPEARRWRRGTWRTLLAVAICLAAVPLAGVNLRRGRGDLRGARRVAGFVFLVCLAAWVLTARHASELTVELRLVALAVAGALIEAALVWLSYVALEPYVRRFWPQTIISWSRTLEGRFRDALVGTNLLAGAVLGVSWALLVRLDRLLPGLFGLTPRPPVRDVDVLTPLLGTASALAAVLTGLLQAIYDGLLLLLLLVLLRIVLRRPMAVGVVAVVLLLPLVMPASAHPAVSWITLGVLALGSAVWAVMRFGLMTVMAALFVSRLLGLMPTVRGDAWYADAVLVIGLVVVGVGLYGTVNGIRAPRGGVRLAA